jgi:probable rRNA maturation factor
MVIAEEVPLPAWNKALKHYVRAVLAEIEKDSWDLSIMLCGDATIAELNSRYRGKNEPTDILSFAQNGEQFPEGGRRLPGDIVISLETLKKNALSFGVSEDEELRRLLIHGILHLDGMDHGSNRGSEPMLVLQERILKKLSGKQIMGRNE